MISIPRNIPTRIAYTASERASAAQTGFLFRLTHQQTSIAVDVFAYLDDDSNARADISTILTQAPDDVDREYLADETIPAGTAVVTTGDILIAEGAVLTVEGFLVTVGGTITGSVDASGGVLLQTSSDSTTDSVQGLLWFSNLPPGEYSYLIYELGGTTVLEAGMMFVGNYDETTTEYDEKSQETKTVYYEPGT